MIEKEFLQKFFKVYNLNDFTKFYNNSNYGIDVNTFLKCKFEILIGTLIEYVSATNNVAVNADSLCYTIYPTKAINEIKPIHLSVFINSMPKYYYLEEHTDTITNNYRLGLTKVIELINAKPF